MNRRIQFIIVIAMIVLTIIPFLVIYEPVSAVIPALPDFVAPSWFIPVGFLNIGLIIVLALSLIKSK